MDTTRTITRSDEGTASPNDAIAPPPPYLNPQGSEFGFTVYSQLIQVQKNLGQILTMQSVMSDQIKGLERKVGMHARLIWIGLGASAVIGSMLGIAQPLFTLLLRLGIVEH